MRVNFPHTGDALPSITCQFQGMSQSAKAFAVILFLIHLAVAIAIEVWPMRIRTDAEYHQALDELDKLFQAIDEKLASEQDERRAKEILDATGRFEDSQRPSPRTDDLDPPPLDW